MLVSHLLETEPFCDFGSVLLQTVVFPKLIWVNSQQDCLEDAFMTSSVVSVSVFYLPRSKQGESLGGTSSQKTLLTMEFPNPIQTKLGRAYANNHLFEKQICFTDIFIHSQVHQTHIRRYFSTNFITFKRLYGYFLWAYRF